MIDGIAAYCRVSTDKQDLRMQIDNLRTLLDDKNPEWYIDYAITGTSNDRLNRAGYARLITDVEQKKITHIYVYEWSRLWRNLEEQTKALSIFLKNNVVLTSITEGTFKTPEDTLLINIKGAINEHEARVIRRRSLDGIKAKQRKCAEAMDRALELGLSYEQIPQNERWRNKWE